MGNAAVGDDRTAVELGGGQVDHGAGLAGLVGQQLPDDLLPGAPRAAGQGRMQVEDGEAGAEVGARDQHVAGQHEQLDAVGVEQRRRRRRERPRARPRGRPPCWRSGCGRGSSRRARQACQLAALDSVAVGSPRSRARSRKASLSGCSPRSRSQNTTAMSTSMPSRRARRTTSESSVRAAGSRPLDSQPILTAAVPCSGRSCRPTLSPVLRRRARARRRRRGRCCARDRRCRARPPRRRAGRRPRGRGLRAGRR